MSQTTAFIPYQSKRPDPLFENFYYHCKTEWSDAECDSMHNDRCPVCNKEIEPYRSRENKTGEEIVHADIDALKAGETPNAKPQPKTRKRRQGHP